MKQEKGFTLIELLVVIAIIGILSSVVLASLDSARVKARDARRIADFKSVSLAMELFYDSFGIYPGNNTLYPNHNAQFEAMAQELVNNGFLGTIPKDPSTGGGYLFYKYGAGSAPGAIIVTYLEGINPTTVGPFNSCRPFANNWCSSTNASTAYCICHPY